MPSKFPYTTHVGLILDVEQDGEEWVCTIHGDHIKELKRGNEATVRAEAEKWYAHFEQRKETDPKDNV